MPNKHELTLADIKPSPEAGSVLYDGLELNPGETFPISDGANIVLQVEPHGDYEFVAWDGDITGTEIKKDFSVENDITFVAEFKEKN